MKEIKLSQKLDVYLKKEDIQKILNELHNKYQINDNPQYANLPSEIVYKNVTFIFGICFGLAINGRQIFELVEDDGYWYSKDWYNIKWFNDKINTIIKASKILNIKTEKNDTN